MCDPRRLYTWKSRLSSRSGPTLFRLDEQVAHPIDLIKHLVANHACLVANLLINCSVRNALDGSHDADPGLARRGHKK
jgi:hypothetical protein